MEAADASGEAEKIVAYKGFDKDLRCKGFQYEVGGEYATGAADICKSGFHACENPLDTFFYYPPSDSRYAEVELEANNQREKDSKRVGKRIKIAAEINMSELIGAAVKFIFDKVDWKNNKETNTGYGSAATNTGHRSAATNTGGGSAATNTGCRSAATNTGDGSAAEVSGSGSVAIATGIDGRVKGALGCAIVAAERGEWDGDTYPLIAVNAAIVDGEAIKPDTWYKLASGEFVAAVEAKGKETGGQKHDA